MSRWAVVTLLLAVAAAPARSAPDAARAESAHYVVTTEGTEDEARETTRVLEAAWPQLEAFFGAAPKLAKDERLRVRCFETAAAMKAAILAGGGAAPDAGGYFCPVAKTAYAWRQPSRWWTRTLTIHEAVHQFHLLGVGAGAKPLPAGWWTEGIAEHLSHHTWDGTTLALGVVPPVSLEDWPAKALAAAGAKEFAPERIVEGPVDRPNAMHLVRFLAKSSPAWKELQTKLDRGVVVKPKDVMKGAGNAAAFREKYVAWLRTAQQPFVNEFVEWDSLAADAVRGQGAVISVVRTRGNADSVEATAAPADASRSRVGVVLEWTNATNYVLGQVENGSRVRVDRLVDGKWAVLFEGALPSGTPPPPWRLSAARGKGQVRFLVGEEAVYAFASGAGPLGLCLDACTADFRAIRVR